MFLNFFIFLSLIFAFLEPDDDESAQFPISDDLNAGSFSTIGYVPNRLVHYFARGLEKKSEYCKLYCNF